MHFETSNFFVLETERPIHWKGADSLGYDLVQNAPGVASRTLESSLSSVIFWKGSRWHFPVPMAISRRQIYLSHIQTSRSATLFFWLHLIKGMKLWKINWRGARDGARLEWLGAQIIKFIYLTNMWASNFIENIHNYVLHKNYINNLSKHRTPLQHITKIIYNV